MTTSEKLVKVAENRERIYEKGKQAEHDRFWDGYQQNGKRVQYIAAFGGVGWTNETFKPKYDIVASDSAYQMFTYSGISGSLKEILEKCNVTMAFTNCNNVSFLFQYAAGITEVGIIDFSTIRRTNTQGVFQGCRKLKAIEKCVLPNVNVTTYSNWFEQCDELEDVVIENCFTSSVSFQYSPLTRESMMGKEITADEYNALSETVQTNNVYVKDGKYYYGGVITALSPTVTGQTATFKATAKTVAFTDAEWSELIATKPNWTFTLV